MKPNAFRFRAAVTLFAAASAGLLCAQEQQGQTQQQKQESQRSSQQQQARTNEAGARGEIHVQAIEASEQEVQRQVTDVNKASKLIGRDVKNLDEQDLGKIEDLVVDLKSGKIAYAVLSVGGFLGINDKLIAVPVNAFGVKAGEKYLLLDLNKQQVENAKGFAQKNWPDLNAVEAGQTVGLAQSGQERRTERRQQGWWFGSDTDRTPAREREEAGEQVIRDFNMLTRGARAELEGRRVQIGEAQVQQVFGENLIAVQPAGGLAGGSVLVKTQQPVRDIKQGQRVRFQGKIQKMPDNVEALGLRGEGPKPNLQEYKAFIAADQVSASERRQ